MAKRTKNGLLIMRRVVAPHSVNAGQEFEVDAEVVNGATTIFSTDPDSCASGDNACTKDFFESPGYCVEIHFYIDGQRQATAGPDCLKAEAVGGSEGEKTVVMEIDEPGTYTIGAEMVATGTGSSTGIVTTEIEVLPSGEEPKETPTPGNGDGGVDIGDGDQPTGGGSGIAQVIVNNPVATAAAVAGLGIVTQLFGGE